jgi:hypothetical protein
MKTAERLRVLKGGGEGGKAGSNLRVNVVSGMKILR